MTRHRFWFAALLAVAAVVASVGAGSAVGRPQAQARHDRRAQLPVLATDFGSPRVRPTTIGYTGDGSGIIGRLPSSFGHSVVGQRPGFLRWTVWTHAHARAVGTLWVLSCTPSCAASPFYRYPVTIAAGRVRDRHFTRLTLYYTYQGQRVVDRRCARPPRYADYGIVLDGRCE
jgi:hypothetical protein